MMLPVFLFSGFLDSGKTTFIQSMLEDPQFNEGQRTPRSTHVAVGGTSNMLSYPEYSDMDKARNFLSLMETRDRLARIIDGSGEMAFTVRIGPETGVPEMADCSIVTATYSTRGGQQGTIGVIGPTRMRYSRVISILNMMGHQLTDMFSGDGGNGTGQDEVKDT